MWCTYSAMYKIWLTYLVSVLLFEALIPPCKWYGCNVLQIHEHIIKLLVNVQSMNNGYINVISHCNCFLCCNPIFFVLEVV